MPTTISGTTGVSQIQDGTVATADIADDAITDAKIAAIAATKLTGTIADARFPATLPAASATNLTSIPAANITGTLPAINGAALTNLGLESIRRDIATLALHSAIADNKAAYNLPNSFIDQFEDDTGIGTETNTDRNTTNEYVASVLANPARYWQLYNTKVGGSGPYHQAMRVYEGGSQVTVTAGMLSHSGLEAWNTSNAFTTGNNWFHTDGPAAGDYMRIDLGAGNEKAIDKFQLWLSGAGIDTIWNIQFSANASSWTTAYTGWDMDILGAAWNEVTWSQNIANATGTLISTAQTANAAQTKVSGVILYKNNEGTATLGTDLKIYFTCNGGTNWTESTPAAAGTFSTGILMAKCPEVTCTSGTDVRYKVEWANQASGSKETQLHGVGMNY